MSCGSGDKENRYIWNTEKVDLTELTDIVDERNKQMRKIKNNC